MKQKLIGTTFTSVVFFLFLMIVWGGVSLSKSLNTGAEYDPLSDRWRPTSTFGAPAPRCTHTAVWTDRGMIIRGPAGGEGARYCTGG